MHKVLDKIIGPLGILLYCINVALKFSSQRLTPFHVYFFLGLLYLQSYINIQLKLIVLVGPTAKCTFSNGEGGHIHVSCFLMVIGVQDSFLACLVNFSGGILAYLSGAINEVPEEMLNLSITLDLANGFSQISSISHAMW